jgi:hypothetical protein
MRILDSQHPASLKGRTVYLKSIKDPDDVKRLIQPASTNSKLKGTNGVITKGWLKGLPMYSLTLEERKTCPKSCEQWNSCYGNNMPFANRIDHNSPTFERSLEAEVSALLSKHPQGLLLRLHVLGDFYSTKYVNFWIKLMQRYPKLRIFGYTHRDPKSPIGAAIKNLNKQGAWIRWSDRKGPMGATVISSDQAIHVTTSSGSSKTGGPSIEGIICPEQTGKTKGCATCGLCWSVKKQILFLRH